MRAFYDTFEDWLVQPGYPVVTLKLCDHDSGFWCAVQERFLFTEASNPQTTQWNVPLDMKLAVWVSDAQSDTNWVAADETVPKWLTPSNEETVL